MIDVVNRAVLTGVVLGCVGAFVLAFGWLLVPAVVVRGVLNE